MTTEPELFHAYQSLGHYKAACACGDDIRAETSDERTVGAAIRLHNLSPLHQQWREWQDAVEKLQRPTSHPCPCHDHGAG